MEESTFSATVSPLDWIVVAIYFAVSAIGGLVFAGKQDSSEDYFVGGRTIPGWAAGLSLFATSISATTFMAFPAQGYGGDLSRLIPHFMLPIAAIYIALLVVPFYRQVVRISAYEYLERRFGYPARAYAALLYVLIQSFRMGFVLFLGATAIHALTSYSLPNSIIVGGLITLVYTTFGGMRADIWTDVIQSFVMFGGAIMCLAVLLFTPEGGPALLFEIAFDAGKLKLADLSFDLTQATIIVMAMQGLFQYADGYSTSQASVQRYLCSPTMRQARLGIFVGATGCIFMWTIFMLIGTLLFSYYRVYPDRLPGEIAEHPLKVFPYFLSTRLPNGFLGVFLAALCAAAMSTLSTAINSLSLSTVHDFFGRFQPEKSASQIVRMSRIVSCFWGTTAIVTALSMTDVKAALDLSISAFSILTGGLFGMFLLAFFVRKAHALGVYVGVAAGAAISLWAALDQFASMGLPLPAVLNDSFPLHVFLTGTLSNTASFVVGYVASMVLPDITPRDPTGLVIWDMNRAENTH